MDSDKRVEALHQLELKYQDISHEAQLTVKDEEVRRLRVRNVLIRDDGDNLKNQLSQREIRIKDLRLENQKIRERFDMAQRKTTEQGKQLRSRTREMALLKEEMESLNTIGKDSAKLLSEKLALSRELDLAKAEQEHLRSQLSHHNETLAEKLALERQVNTLEVALANEKRASQKQAQDSVVEKELRKELAVLEKELARQAKAAEKADLAIEKHSAKADQLREELHDTQARLLAAQKQVETEKRAAKRLLSEKGSSNAETDEALAELRQQLEESEQALAQERESKDSAARKDKAALVKSEAQRQAFEEKVQVLEAQLREMRIELEESRSEAQKAQQEQKAALPAVTTTSVPTKKAAPKTAGRKKKRADELRMDAKSLETPNKDDDRPKRPLKKRGFEHTLVGEKSMFSITPFLNKTVNLTEAIQEEAENTDTATKTATVLQFRGADDEKTAADNSDDNATEAAAAQDDEEPDAAKLLSMQDKKARGRPRKALGDAPTSKKTLATKDNNKKLSGAGSVGLEKVTEEEDEPRQGVDDQTTNDGSADGPAKKLPNRPPSKLKASAAGSASDVEPEPKKKKRKLLASASNPTIFEGDDEEGEVVKRPAKAVAAPKAFNKMPMAVNRVKNAFGGSNFSPLKRDRRGANATFLG